MPLLISWLLLVTLQVSLMEASHFRGGIITWRPENTQPEPGEIPRIIISWRVSWRRSEPGHTCFDSFIEQRVLRTGEGSLICSCPGSSIPLSYICTDYNIAEDWTTGVNSQLFSTTETSFGLGFTGSAWLTLLNGFGTWNLRTTVDLRIRSDTGMVNTSPITATTPVVPFKVGCTNTLQIPVNDVDNDDVRCFWASYCGGICGPVVGFNLNSDTCELVLPDTQAVTTGLYGMAIEIRDFATEASNSPLSQIPLQFLLEVYETPEACNEIPIFIAPSLECGTCHPVPAGTTYNAQFVARTSDSSVSITSIETVSPTGLLKSAVTPYEDGMDTDYLLEITWTPDDLGVQEILCFLARDSADNTSPLCCVILYAGAPFPEIISTTPASGSFVLAGELEMQLQFSMGIARPTESALISVFDNTDTLVFQVDASDDTEVDFLENNVISFVIPADDYQGSYYITMGDGVALTTASCSTDSVAITDTSVLTFSMLQPWDFQCFVTPPVRNLQSMKPVELLAVAGGGPGQFSATFRSRDSGEIYSDGRFVNYDEILGTSSADGDTALRIHKANLMLHDNECRKADRFGVHFCDYFSNLQRYSARVLIHNQEALIPRNAIRTIVLSVGETLTLCIDPNIPRTWKGPIVWSFNGHEPSWLRRWTSSSCIHVKHIETCQAGVYEAYRRICGKKPKQHAFFDVRVRGCPDGFHTPPFCTGVCPSTCVLGYCGDDGECLCRNGLTGENCDTATRGQFGLISGNIPCSTVGLHVDCKGSLMCTQHAGCSCAPGWKGINCDKECDALTWGPDCVFSCNGGVACDRFTGNNRPTYYVNEEKSIGSFVSNLTSPASTKSWDSSTTTSSTNICNPFSLFFTP